MNRENMDRWCERGILALVLAILVFGPLALGAVRLLEFAVIQWLTAGVLLLWAARLWIAPRPQLLWPPICWAVLAFVGYAIARYYTADIEYVARQEVLRVIVYAFLFFAILNNLHRQETTQVIGFTLIFLAMTIACYAIYQFLAGSDYVWRFIKPYPGRGSGTYICPNHLGGFLELILLLALAYTFTGRAKPLTKVFLGYAALVIVAGIAATVSRGSWASTAGALGLFFVILLRRRNYRLPTLILMVALVAGSYYAFSNSRFLQHRVEHLVTGQGAVDDDLRFALWRPAFQMWRDYPWFGVGPAHFDSRFRAYRPEGVQLSPDRVHNDYLNTLTDWGSVGAVLVVSAWVLLGWGVARAWRHVRLSSADLGGKSGSNKFAFILGASLGLAAILAHSVLDFNLQIPANAILVVTFMALLSAYWRFATERFWLRAGLGVKLLAGVLLLIGAVYLGRQGWIGAREFVWLDRAKRAPNFSRAQIDLLQKAFAIEPMNAQTARAIGEACRIQSQEGGGAYEGQEGVDYQQLAQEGLIWFERGMRLNPWDSRNYAGYGWCLDWLDRRDQSGAYFSRAEELDPNNYFNLNMIGLHYVQLGDFAAAKPWFERSIRLEWENNVVAKNYLQIANLRLSEGATNAAGARLDSLPH